VLIDRRNLWKLHGRWIAVTGAIALAAIGLVWVLTLRSGRWPGGGSAPGLILGSLAAVIILFELAIVLKKTRWLRTARWALSAQTWMKAHIWFGLLTVPLVLLHSGGKLGGTLTIVLLAVFAVAIASGVWGLTVQNLLPKMLLEAAPAETIYSQIDSVGRQYAEEAQRLVSLACGDDDRELVGASANAVPEYIATGGGLPIAGAARHVGPQIERRPHPASQQRTVVPSEAIQNAMTNDIEPFLNRGMSAALGSRQRNQWYFDDLRQRVPRELRGLAGQLEELCERRRQLNVQRRLHFWLHNWLWLHLPLSVALVWLLVAHVIGALVYS
jgi:hypothetical protein